MNIKINPQVKNTLQNGGAVVALESTVMTHGLPRPQNLELARSLEAVVSSIGATPATVGIIAGEIIVGLNVDEMEYLANAEAEKASIWNLAAIVNKKQNGGTTVATTLHAANAAGVKVFATGGIGGVHHEEYDESADLAALAKYPLITVCAGPKSILNVEATLERLESLAIATIGYKSDKLAGFHSSLTDLKTSARADSAKEIAEIFLTQQSLGLNGLLISNPVKNGMPREKRDALLVQAHKAAKAANLKGKEVTPFLLSKLAEISNDETIEVNLRLLEQNAHLGAKIAIELAKLEKN